MDINAYSKDFQVFYFWFISDNTQASVARARGDVPIDLATKLTGSELELAKELIFAKFKNGGGRDYYVNILYHWKEKRAIPYIHKYCVDCKERRKGLAKKMPGSPMCYFSSEIKLCKKALRELRKM